jgi:hypothetical protein
MAAIGAMRQGKAGILKYPIGKHSAVLSVRKLEKARI